MQNNADSPASSPSGPTAAAPRFFAKLLAALALAALILYCVVGAVSVNTGALQLMGNPLDNMLPEGANAFVAVHAASTGHLYLSYNEAPHVLQPFGPLFYVFTSTVARLSRLDVDLTVRHIREITYASYLCGALMIFLICRKLRSPMILAILAAVMFLGQLDFLGWSVTVRPDVIMLLCALLSLFFALRINDDRWLSCLLSGFFAGTAFLFKQPGAAVAVAILLVLLLRKEFRRLVLFSAAAAVPVVVMFLTLILRKESFWEQFTCVGRAYWSLAEGARFFGSLVVNVNYLLPALIGLLGLLGARKMGKSWQFIISFLLVTAAAGLSGMPQIGSNTNYFIPALAACSLLLPAAIEFLRNQPQLKLGALIIVPAFLYGAYAEVQHNARYVGYFRVSNDISYAPLRSLRLFTDYPLLTLKGRDPEFLDGFSTHSLELTGSWSSAPIVAEIRQGRFDAVILKRLMPRVVFNPRPEGYKELASWRGISEFSPEVVSALNENYNIFCSGLYSLVLKPNNRSLNVAPEYFSQLFQAPCKTGAANRPPHLILAEGAR